MECRIKVGWSNQEEGHHRNLHSSGGVNGGKFPSDSPILSAR